MEFFPFFGRAGGGKDVHLWGGGGGGGGGVQVISCCIPISGCIVTWCCLCLGMVGIVRKKLIGG